MTPSSLVQTPQEGRSLPGPTPGSGEGSAVCLRSTRGGKLRVVWSGSEGERMLREAGYEDASDVYLSRACRCGCGLPVPFQRGSLQPSPLQQYADPDGCRRAIYALMHPTLDLSGMLPEKAKQAARMAEEAVRAAKLGQPRATVDARSEVEHAALRPDPRPSCRLRVTPRHFELLAEIKALGFHAGESFSAIVMELIEREAEDCRLRAKQEGEHDV
jgi:hypothetical protein